MQYLESLEHSRLAKLNAKRPLRQTHGHLGAGLGDEDGVGVGVGEEVGDGDGLAGGSQQATPANLAKILHLVMTQKRL